MESDRFDPTEIAKLLGIDEVTVRERLGHDRPAFEGDIEEDDERTVLYSSEDLTPTDEEDESEPTLDDELDHFADELTATIAEREETTTVLDRPTTEFIIPDSVRGITPDDAIILWSRVAAVMPHSRRMLFYGPPSTGKTFFANTIGVGDKESEVFSITMTEETSSAEIRGHFINRGPDTVWHYGPAARAWIESHGARRRLVINEIDRASADALTLLYAILDDPEFAQLTLPNGETIRPGAGFSVVATMNGVPGDLPDALQSRFPVKVNVQYPNPAAIAALDPDLRTLAQGLAVRVDENRQDLRAFFEFQSLRKVVALDVAGDMVFGDQWSSIKSSLVVGGDA